MPSMGGAALRLWLNRTKSKKKWPHTHSKHVLWWFLLCDDSRFLMRNGLLGSVRMGVACSAVYPRQTPCTHTVRHYHLDMQMRLSCRSTEFSGSWVMSGLGAPMISSHATATISVRNFVPSLVSKSYLVSWISTPSLSLSISLSLSLSLSLYFYRVTILSCNFGHLICKEILDSPSILDSPLSLSLSLSLMIWGWPNLNLTWGMQLWPDSVGQ